MRSKKIVVYCFAVLVIVATTSRVDATRAFGITPPNITIDNIHIGTPVRKVIKIANGDWEEGAKIEVRKTGEGSKYIKLPYAKFNIASNTKWNDYQIIIDVKGARAKSYESELVFSASQIGGAESDVKQRLELRAKIKVTATTVATHVIRLANTFFKHAVLGEPVELRTGIINEGNQDERFVKAVLEFMPEKGAVSSSVKREILLEKYLPAFSSDDISLTIKEPPTEDGAYRVHISLETKDGVKVEGRTTAVIGDLKKIEPMPRAESKKVGAKYVWLAVLGGLLILSAVGLGLKGVKKIKR